MIIEDCFNDDFLKMPANLYSIKVRELREDQTPFLKLKKTRTTKALPRAFYKPIIFCQVFFNEQQQ